MLAIASYKTIAIAPSGLGNITKRKSQIGNRSDGTKAKMRPKFTCSLYTIIAPNITATESTLPMIYQLTICSTVVKYVFEAFMLKLRRESNPPTTTKSSPT